MIGPESLNVYYVVSGSLILILIAVLFVSSLQKIGHSCRNINFVGWLLLFMLLIALFLILMYVVPHYHKLFLDDHYALATANSIVNNEVHYINMPLFIHNALLFVPTFLIFGVNVAYSFYTMIVISIISLIFFFLLSYMVTKNYWPALFATTLVAFNTVHIDYSLYI